MSETVPLKEYIEALDQKNARYIDMVDQKNQAALRAALAAEQLARTVALVEIKAGQQFHNDLIRKGERASATYVTRGQVYAALGTVLIVVGLGIAWMGVS